MNKTVADLLADILRRSALETRSHLTLEEFPSLFAALGWKVRNVKIALQQKDLSVLQEAGLPTPESLGASDFARLHLLLCTLARLPAAEHAGLIDGLFREGDNRERETVLRGLVLLPDPARFLSTAVDACRSAVQSTFEAIACHNRYPAKFFPPEPFRAMVLKALHLGVDPRRIEGLAGRCDADLQRMAADYGRELTAAGRPHSAGVAYILEEEKTA